MSEITKILYKYQKLSNKQLALIIWLEEHDLIPNKSTKHQLKKIPHIFVSRVREVVTQYLKRKNNQKAKQFISKLVDICSGKKLSPTLNDKQVAVLASECAVICEELAYKNRYKPTQRQIDILEREVDTFGLTYAETKTDKAKIAKYCCSKWWLRKLRKTHFQDIEHIAQLIGLVNKTRQKFVSNYTHKRKTNAQSIYRNYFSTLLAIDELDNEHELIDLVESSLANTKNRRADLFMRLFGAVKYAECHGLKAHFITILCPKEMKTSFKEGHLDSRYIGTSTKEAHDFINLAWKNARSALDKKTKSYFGFRFVEPCHDGSPHWHLIVFTTPENSELVNSVLTRRITQQYTFKNNLYKCQLTAIELHKLKDVLQCAKYITKFIKKHSGKSGDTPDIDRVCAWASANRIRQFAQFGMPAVGLMRTARRFASHTNIDIKALFNFSINGDWLGFIEKLGWQPGERKRLDLEICYKPTSETDIYGDPYERVNVGLRYLGKVYKAKLQSWQIKSKGNNLNQ